MSTKKNTTSEVAVQWAQQNPALAQRGIDEAIWNALKTSIFPGAQDQSVVMAWDYCSARKLDVMMKPVHIVPMYVKDKQANTQGMRDVIMPGVGMYRIQADRSGDYAGADAVEFGPMVTREFTNKDGKKVSCTFPEYATMTVYKLMPTGERVGFSVTEYWEENYATDSNKSDAPNSMWMKRPRGQLAKCVEAQCLRRGWPEIGQDVTAEEMEGKTFDTMRTINETQPAGGQKTETTETGAKLFPDATFEQRYPLWEKDIADGNTTVDKVIHFVESKGYQLTALQLDKLNAINPVINGDSE